MNAFEVYLVMQLDEICVGLRVLIVIAALCSFALLLASFARSELRSFLQSEEEKSECEADAKKYATTAKKMAVAAIALVLVNALLPSTKTAAAMIVLPALTSEAVQAEAKEFYDLAKEALKQAIGHVENEKTKPESEK